ncbi:hypothetical protein CRUP_032108, partial [Coryphaenoides rupestris]
VDLGFLRFVSAIGTQGAISQETSRTYFVKSYKVDVSSNGEDWITLKEGSKQKVFQGNTNPMEVAKAKLPKPTLTRYLRIRPVAWETGIALRFEVDRGGPTPTRQGGGGAGGRISQIFEGNMNYDTPELRSLEPLLTRYIRVYPERAAPAGMGLRLEILGCEIQAPTAAPTTQAPSVAPADECEDGRPGCHGDTGDDYDPTGAPNTAPPPCGGTP